MFMKIEAILCRMIFDKKDKGKRNRQRMFSIIKVQK